MRGNVQVLYQPLLEELQSSNESVNEDKPEEDQDELYGCAKCKFVVIKTSRSIKKMYYHGWLLKENIISKNIASDS
ncbi:hypothetical protein QE152_g37173 [Popillia japonica]|uniref:Uncharacterized protein n=1 Tax=Popillia japonica TaxID=7064 RepID=A0AAW1IBA6_POPJA